MNTLGPYLIGVNETTVNGIQVPISALVGTKGMIEILNMSSCLLNVSFQNQGAITVPAQSQGIWRLIADQMGTQTVIITASQFYQNQAFLNGGNAPFGTFIPQIWVNVYQEDETEWYPPFVYTQSIDQGLIMWQSQVGAAGYTLALNDSNLQPYQMTFVHGFDVSISEGTANASSHITISNLAIPFAQSTNPLQYFISSSTTQCQNFSVRFPKPIPGIGPGGGVAVAPTFTVPAISTSQVSLIVYYTIN